MTLRSWRGAWRTVRQDGLAKIGAIVAALLIWFVASSDPGVTVQRSLLVPLEVTGVDPDEVAVGVPTRVEVVITGPADRMERLGAGDVDALLDVGEVDGEFARPVEARVPQALRVERVVPAEVIGRLEAVRAATFDVVPYLGPVAAGRVAATVDVAPAVATVEARGPVLAEVASVVAHAAPGQDGVAVAVLVAVDADGRPVAETRVVPAVADVTVRTAPAPGRAVRPVALASPSAPNVTVASLQPTEVVLVGPDERLAQVGAVGAEVPDATASLPPGRYDLPVRLTLPSGVASESLVEATVVVGPTDAPPAAP